MLGIIFILISFLFGYSLIKTILKIKAPIFSITGAFLCGSLLSGTVLYLLDLFFSKVFNNFSLGIIVFMLLVSFYLVLIFKRKRLFRELIIDISEILKNKILYISFLIFGVFSLWLYYYTFRITNGNIQVVGGAWSDIIYHNAYVRTVGIGQNIPTEYPYFANSSMHYHFMFNYLCGKLHQLGLHSVHALNIMSAFSLTALLMLIVQFGKTFFKNYYIGFLGSIFLLFHSSLSAFTWINDNYKDNFIQNLFSKTGWLIGARFEEWGLFNLNVFINRRNFAFGLAILLFITIYFIEYRNEHIDKETNEGKGIDFKRIFLIACIIGSLPFWNVISAGICLVFCLLFALTAIKNKKVLWQLLGIFFLSCLFVLPQILYFKSGSETILSNYPKIHLGYGSESANLFDVLIYYFKVLGLKTVLIFVSLLLLNRRKIVDFFILLSPFIMANVVQFGEILYDNNQLIIIWLIFVNCFASYVIYQLFKIKYIRLKVIPIILIPMIIFAGVLDFFSILNLQKATLLDKESELKSWIVSSTEPNSIFLTDFYIGWGDSSMVTVNLAGRKLFAVRNCVDSSIDVNKRFEIMKDIYSLNNGYEETLVQLKKNKITHIIIDELVKMNDQLNPDEEAYDKYFPVVYKDDNLKIYSVETVD